ncbi:MAG: CUB domain-containing protein [Kangiellaceae bacterium]|nr:CUB domain-containing protein [Kangiellaceae bacterium]
MSPGCGGTAVRFNGSGIIRSHPEGTVADFANSADCRAIVEVPEYKLVKVTFSLVNFPDSQSSVKLYDEREAEGQLIFEVTHLVATEFLSSSNVVIIRYRRHPASGDVGFVLNFESVNAEFSELLLNHFKDACVSS